MGGKQGQGARGHKPLRAGPRGGGRPGRWVSRGRAEVSLGLGSRGHDGPLVVGPGDEIAPVGGSQKRLTTLLALGAESPLTGDATGAERPLPR